MANEEHLRILSEEVDAWNQWRKENPSAIPDLSAAALCAANLRSFDLHGAALHEADLRGVNLREANLAAADLWKADLRRADLTTARLRWANLSEAQLHEADLSWTDLREADLRRAILRSANLRRSDLSKAYLGDANLTNVQIGGTTFGDVDLSSVIGLETARHTDPSTIGIDTLYKSSGKIPKIFLSRAGVPDRFITCIDELVGRIITFYSCFISYSSKDDSFASRLRADLQTKGITAWFAPEDLRIGDKIRQSIYEAIRYYDKLLLVLSQNSVESTWVEQEVEAAFEEEARHNRIILVPIRLDDDIMTTNRAWAAQIRTRHIGDFTRWKEHDAYIDAFDRLLTSLKTQKG